MSHERGDVFGPIAERRDLDLEASQTVIEVLSEQSFPKHLDGLPVRGCEKAGTHKMRLGGTYRAYLSVVENPKELRLLRQPEGLQFIQEEDPSVGLVEEALVVPIGAREGSAAMPEKFAVEQLRCGGAAVMRDERPLAEARQTMDGSGDKFLAGSRLARDQDARVAASGQEEQVPDCHHGFAHSDNLGRIAIGARVPRASHDSFPGGSEQDIGRDGFHKVIRGSSLNRLYDRGGVTRRSDDNDRDLRPPLLDQRQELQAFHVGQAQVEDDEVGKPRFHRQKSGDPFRSGPEVFEFPGQDDPHVLRRSRIVLHH